MTKHLYKVTALAFLILAVFIAMAPFLDVRVLRMAGDEKVYVTQALEMMRDGRWFVQTLAEEPSYFKGPLHYILAHLGLLVFGNRLIAGTWMNGAFALLAGLAMFKLGRRRWTEKSGLLLAVATALNVGVFSHALISQMEVEVFAFYAFALAALGLAKKAPDFKHDLLFWLTAGIAGWIKSPVHSVLISLGGLCFWGATRQLAPRLKTPSFWFGALMGVAVGVAGYLPAYLLDQKNFVETYILREQFQKANNQRSWIYVAKPLLHFALPWTFVILAGVVSAIRSRKALLASADLPMLKLGLAMFLPTFFFWCSWSYKGQNYNLPALPALLLAGWACFNGNVPRWAYKASGIIGAAAFFLALGIIAHFWPLPAWWGKGWILLALCSMAAFSWIFLFAEDNRALGVGAVMFFLAFGAFIAPLGEREMIDAREFIKNNPNKAYYYYNLDPSIWSEWALLQLALHHPIRGLHKEKQLPEAIQPGHAVLVQNKDNLVFIENYWRRSQDPSKAKRYAVIPWNRWLTKGTSSEGKSQWRIAWDTHDLRQLEREFYIVDFK